MNDEQLANLFKWIESTNSAIHELTISISTIIGILEVKGICSSEQFQAARTAASPVVDQIIEEIKEKNREDEK